MSITKKIVDETAFLIIKTEGMEALTARHVADKARCSTQPIYKIYSNLDELKKSAIQKVSTYCDDIIFGYKKAKTPFLDAGLGFIHFAATEKILFKVFCIENYLQATTLSSMTDRRLFGLMEQLLHGSSLSDEERQEIFVNTMIFTNGLAQMAFSGQLGMTEKQVAERLIEFFFRFSGVKCEGGLLI